MKRLIIVRHAKSSWNHPELADFDRPLNRRGERNAPLMGRRLRELRAKPQLMFSSPAKRAISTARLLADELGYQKKHIIERRDLYGSGANELLGVLRGIDDEYTEVLLCGHNPELTNLYNFLANSTIDNIPTCGIACMDFDVASWVDLTRGSGRLVYFEYPKGL